MLLKGEVLKKINGFKAFAHVLAEDHLIGKEVRKAGYNIYHSSFVINNKNIQWTMKRFFNRHIRWAMMRRKLNVFHYIAEILANPIMMAFVYLVATFNYESFIIFNLISFIKIIFDFKISTAVGADLKWYQYLLIPVKDILIGFIWFVPFVYNKIDWRGNTFFISRGTKLKPV
jgi:ceramide glucosyltransferase